jgi:hypothetical protein
MGEFLAGVVVTAFAVFVYRKIKSRKASSSAAPGGARPAEDAPSDKV